MEVIYVYYNQNSDKFYYRKYVCWITDDRLKNNYGHVIVQKIIIKNDYIMDLNLYLDSENKKKLLVQESKKSKRINRYNRRQFIKKVINHIIDLLYIIKSKF